ncbi:MAG TPA: FUSC family protein [Microlunatus sp.]|nr:FUSC family protein [Microlunatus sp.]
MTADAALPDRPKPVVWSWPHALIGVVFALPAAIASLVDPSLGIPLAVGVLPATIIGVPARRRARSAILIIGSLAGASLFLGGALAHLPTPVTGVLLIAVVVGAALLAARISAGMVVLSLCAPLVGAGLSYDSWSSAAATMGLMIGSSTYAWLVSLLWPARSVPERPQRPLPPSAAMLDYGVRMGLAAAVVYLIAADLGLDHPGWAPAACLLVARPQLDLLRRRGVGRVVSVTVGALAAVLLLHLDPPNAVLAVTAIAVLAGAAGTTGSRWYISSAFTTLLVLLMMLGGHPEETTGKVNERVGETVLGVAAAYLFGWAIPVLRRRLRS